MPVEAPERAEIAAPGPEPTGQAQAGGRPDIGVVRLGRAPVGLRATVVGISVPAEAAGLTAEELERRLLEMGFVEGASVEILHQGLIRRDPIAVRLDDMRVALRRREADAVLVRPLTDGRPAKTGRGR